MKDIVALLLEINKRQKGYYVGKLFYRRKLFNIQVIKRTTQKIKASLKFYLNYK